MIHIYTGDGKGKTSAAIGLAIRATGAGMKTILCQFLKNGTSSEIEVLEKIGISVLFCQECNKFTFQMNDKEKSAVKNAHDRIIDTIDYTADIIIMDEFLDAYNLNLIDRKKSEEFILNFKGEIILTGHDVPQIFADMADYITIMKKIKHPYDNGTEARKGIEY